MYVVANTEELVADNIIGPDAAREIERRGRGAMVTLAINLVLCFGILAATGGLIFWLADALSVAVVGACLLGGGLFALFKAPETYRMFGNAAALDLECKAGEAGLRGEVERNRVGCDINLDAGGFDKVSDPTVYHLWNTGVSDTVGHVHTNRIEV